MGKLLKHWQNVLLINGTRVEALKTQNVIYMSHTKSCWLTLEAMAFASWIIVGGSAVISAARRPGGAQTMES